MNQFGWVPSFATLVITVLLPVLNAVNISEPNRTTQLYGQDFLVAVPLTTGLPEEGSFLQIACISCLSSTTTGTGTINLLSGNFSDSFTLDAAPPIISLSLHISALEPLATNTTPAIFNITADVNITVSVIVKVGGSLSAFTAIPSASLDKYYLVTSPYMHEDHLSELTVVAIQPDTSFQFRPNINVTVRDHEDIPVDANFHLGTGGWLEYQTRRSFMGGHFHSEMPMLGIVGTHLTSHELSWVQSLDQMFPLPSLGTRYTAVPLNSMDIGNIFLVVAIWKNTDITWYSGRHSTGNYQHGNTTLNNGQIYEIAIGKNQIGYIWGSKPFLLLHYIELGSIVLDTALVTVPPAEQFTKQAFIFSTMYTNSPEVSNYISVMAPCEYFDEILLTPIPTKGSALKFAERPAIIDGDLCGAIRPLESGEYMIRPSPDFPDAVYSAILYGNSDRGVFSYILASELYQVTCSVNNSQVHLCTEVIRPSLTTTAASTIETSTAPNKDKNISSGTVIGAVLAALSVTVGLAIVGYCVYRYLRVHHWRRLDESEYMEDNPLRMQSITDGQSTF
ncbi:uncharacterized protein LOC110989058 [Acanthaster planci]|uniref:Uncharacterized protein LOC110989058 n=1 Tax=Acanthaster planci TaxID=133434 RepID=A0A8B7ZZ41_ACAPL|nr:uncharacterized protein LOC110989058 [Acanthaster planci]XP_022108851.1 uncharacterized protein LOC110989058 [Acanthaster planci]XP_022108852.1 uncharacterized protein LOC110989058 [Acanthaster planci]